MCRSDHSDVSTRGHVVKSRDTPNSHVDSHPRHLDLLPPTRRVGHTTAQTDRQTDRQTDKQTHQWGFDNNNLTRRAWLPSGLYSIFADVFFSLFLYNTFNGQHRRKSISGTTKQIFTKFSGLIELCKRSMNLTLICRLLKGKIITVKKSAFFSDKS